MKPTNYHLFDFLDFDPGSVKRRIIMESIQAHLCL